MSINYTPAIICGRKSEEVVKFLSKDVLNHLLDEEKLQTGYSSTYGEQILGVQVNTISEYLPSPEELSSDVDGAMQLFQLRTGLSAQIHLCVQSY